MLQFYQRLKSIYQIVSLLKIMPNSASNR